MPVLSSAEGPADQPTPDHPKRKSRRGGRRPGAGAPKGNLNALKPCPERGASRSRRDGLRSRRFASMFQHAKDIAGGRLNFEPPTHEWRSINREIAHISPAQIQAAVEKKISRDAQSKFVSDPQPTIRDQIGKSID